LLTFWRDKSARRNSRHGRFVDQTNREVPLPSDALQADFAVEGAKINTQGQRLILSLASHLARHGQDL